MEVGVDVRELAAVVATVLAAVGALPQLRRLLTSRDVAGLSISSAALGVGTELAWVGYTVHEGLWLAVPEAVMMASINGLLAVVMLRAGAPGGRALLSGMAWAATLLATCAVWGSIGLAVLLAVAYVVQVAPAIWCVYRATCPSGVAVGTWVTIGVEAVLWGLYGWWSRDVACLAFGVVGSAAAVGIVGRVVTTRRRRSASGVDDRSSASDEFFARLKFETVEMLEIAAGNRVLDLGWGTGEGAAAMGISDGSSGPQEVNVTLAVNEDPAKV